MTYNQFTSRDVTSLSVNPERSLKETKTVLSSSFSAKSYDHYSGMKGKKLTLHSRVSVDLKFAHFVMMFSAKVHVNINFERFTMQIMLLGHKCYPLDYF